MRLHRLPRCPPLTLDLVSPPNFSNSEKLSDLQLEMLEEEPGVSRQEVAAESEREPLPGAGDEEKKRERCPHPGRQTLPADLPRVEKVIAFTPEQCVCGNCGKQTVVIGYEESEVSR